MRIVAGKYRGRTLKSFDGEKIRPTSDKARESLFSILQFKIYGKSFLDLFAGTGAMGIEALSRGAKFAWFNDYSRDSVALIKSNLLALRVEEEHRVTNADAITLLKTLSQKFDYIYIDPPYASQLKNSAITLSKDALTDDGVIIFEDERAFDGDIEGLTIFDRRKYGRIHLTFFKKEER